MGDGCSLRCWKEVGWTANGQQNDGVRERYIMGTETTYAGHSSEGRNLRDYVGPALPPSSSLLISLHTITDTVAFDVTASWGLAASSS